MKVTYDSKTNIFTLVTETGATWTRAKIYSVGTVEFKSENSKYTQYRDLYELDETDHKLFPWATHRMTATSVYNQNDPLWFSVPVGIKPGTKRRMLVQFSDDEPIQNWEIKHFRINNK